MISWVSVTMQFLQSDADRDLVAKETVAQMIDEESELISIYYGEDMKGRRG